MTNHALRTWVPLPKPLVAYVSGEHVHILAFGFERDTMLYVTTNGRVIEATDTVVVVND